MAIKTKGMAALFLLGIIFLSVGLGYAYFQMHWSHLSIVLVGLGIFFLSMNFLLSLKGVNQKISLARFTKKFYVALGIAALIGGCVLLNYLGIKYEKRFDLTRTKQHTLLNETVEYLSHLETKVQMTIFYVGIAPKYLEDLLKEYERQSLGRITTEIIDPIVDIGYASKFGQTISGQEKKLIVQSGAERHDADFTDGPLTEEKINNALIQTTRESRTACFVAGHEEYELDERKADGLSKFVDHLLANNILVQSLFLGNDKPVPEECRILVVAGPKKDFSEKEYAIIQDYLEQGGDALFLIEHALVTTPDKPLTAAQEKLNPSLNQLFTKWGIAISDDIVVDLKSHASGDVGSPATNSYMSHKAIVGDLDYTFFVRPRSIRMIKDKPFGLRLAPLVLTSSKETSWGESNRYLDVKFDAQTDREGPVPIAFVGWQPKKDIPSKLSDTRFVVVTDADFLTNAYVDAYSNAKFGINILNWLSEKDYQTFLSKKDVKIVRLDLTSQQKRIIILVLVGMLILIASCGIFMWLNNLEK